MFFFIPSFSPVRIDGFSPTQGEEGTAITIFGSGFTYATGATVGGVAIDSFTIVDDSTITGTIGAGTVTGKVAVDSVESVTDFVIVAVGVEWPDIEGDPYTNTELTEILDRSWKYTLTVNGFTVPSDGGTVDVEVEDARYYIPGNFPIIVSTGATIAQFNLGAKTGNILTLERFAYHTSNTASFAPGAYLYPGIEVNQVVNIVSDLGLDALSSAVTDLETEVNGLATVAKTGSYNDLSNKPSLATVATSGSYADLSGKPTIPTKQKGAFGINIQSPTNGTRILFTMPFATTIINFNDIKTTAGTCTLNLTINSVSVTPMSAINVTSTPQNITATANNIGVAGNRVELVVSANSSGANLTGTLYLEADL